MRDVFGKVWLVGGGPGDPGLITARAREVLGAADVVLYDSLVAPELLELCPRAELRSVGKRFGSESTPQAEIRDALLEHARKGRRVVRLKGGDPTLFGRACEEVSALAGAGIPFEIVPGVPSPLAAAAYAGIPLTHLELSSSLAIVTGKERSGTEWSSERIRKLGSAVDTVCILMGTHRLEEIAAALVEGGRAPGTPAAIVEWATTPRQRVVVAPLHELPARARAAGIGSPAVVFVGEVVGLRERHRWFDSRPLFGRRVLVPRPEHQAAETARAVRARGAAPVVFPVIELHDPPDPGPFREAMAALDRYAWVLFTSANGVDRSFAELDRLGRDARAFGRARIGAIGPRTAAALTARGLRADVVADEFVGEGLARSLLAADAAGPVLLPRARVAREALPDTLRGAGLQVDVVAAYETRPLGAERAAALAELLAGGRVDTCLFTSTSTVTATMDALGDRALGLLHPLQIACIGPVTERAAAERGLRVDVTARSYTAEGLLDALEERTRADAAARPAPPA
ncbi:MAG: uroporphyrinogen-III C-methyltransferase [Polyangiaceae bacterium]|nr:uroporphyrinogen-III C-methyltransferase [Polyangiaceae bacterium]